MSFTSLKPEKEPPPLPLRAKRWQSEDIGRRRS